LHVVGQLDVLI